MIGELWRRLWYFLNRSRLERELRDEMAAHRAMKGDTGPRFGNELRLREESADAWGWTWLERCQQDMRDDRLDRAHGRRRFDAHRPRAGGRI